MAEIEYGILGPLEVAAGGRRVTLGAGRQRRLLAVLLVHAGEVVSTDRLIHELWGERPPETARKALQGHVSQLRKVLGPDAIVTRPPGYALRIAPGLLDADRFETLVEEARGAEPALAVAKLEAALALWRGPALADFADDDFARDLAGRLEERRLQALEARIDAQLALARHVDVVAELEQLVARNPLREHLRAQLMLALYRSGRQADALKVYREGRVGLVEELGLEPGPELQELYRAILDHDPALAARARPGPLATRRHRTLLVGALAGVVAAAVSIPVLALGRGGASAPRVVAANSVAVVEPRSNAVIDQIPVGARPVGIVSSGKTVWVANVDDQSVSRIDPKTMAVVRTIPLKAPPSALAPDSRELWVASGSTHGSGLLTRVDAEFDSPAEPSRIPGSSTWPNVWPAVTTGFGDLWIAHTAGVVLRRDPRSGRTLASIDVGSNPTAIAAGDGAVWVANTDDGTVSRIDPTNVVTATTPVGHGPGAVAVGAGGVWVATLDGVVARLDPASGAVTARYSIGGHPTGIAAGKDAVWVADAVRNSLLRVDPQSGRVVSRIRLGNTPEGVVLVDGRPWATVAARQAPVASGPGVARLDLREDISSTDPALAADTQAFQLLYATCAKLLNYPDQPSPEGSQLVPEVAQSVPMPSAGGREYTFRIRPGFRFSPPSNQPVTAGTFKHSIERTLDPRMKNTYLAQTLGDIMGVPGFEAGRARHISGILVRGNALTIRLTHAAPDFLSRISQPAFCAVPTNTPVDQKGVPAIPAAGPYYVASYVPGRRIVLKRNPNYRGSRPHHLAEIDYTIGVAPARAVAAIERGRADYVPDGVPSSENQRLLHRFGPGSGAAKEGRRQQYFVDPVLSIRMLSLNTSRPLFSDVRLRRAVNYAIDRPAIVAQEARATRFGFSAGTANDAYLPPGTPGYPGVHVYPLDGPDLRKARMLAGGKRRAAVLYTCNRQPCPQNAQIIRADLARIGIEVDVKEFPVGDVYNRISRPGEPYDLVTVGFAMDYPDPADVLDDPTGHFFFSYFDNPAFLRRLRVAQRLPPPARYRAYSRLALGLEKDASPWVVIENDTSRDFFSARMGCQTYQPIYGMDIAALCLERRR